MKDIRMRKAYCLRANELKNTTKLERQISVVGNYLMKRYGYNEHDFIKVNVAHSGNDFIENKVTVRYLFHEPTTAQ